MKVENATNNTHDSNTHKKESPINQSITITDF